MAPDLPFLITPYDLDSCKMITVKVLLFSTIRSTIGQRELMIELPSDSSVLDLKHKIAQIYPQAEPTMEFMLASVDRVFSRDDTILLDQVEVAFFPHISGG